MYSFQCYEIFACGVEVIPASAKEGHGVDDVKEILPELLVGSSYYSKVSIIDLFLRKGKGK